MRAVVGLVCEVLGRLVVVRGANEPHVLRNREGAAVAKVCRGRLDRRGHEIELLELLILLERGTFRAEVKSRLHLRIAGSANTVEIDAGAVIEAQTEGRNASTSTSNATVGTRIGIDYAGEDAEKPWRFWVNGNEFVSKSQNRER